MRGEKIKKEVREMREIKKKRERRNKLIFVACTVISGAAAMLGINALPVMAADDVGEEITIGESMGADIGAGADAAGKLSENSRGGVNKSGDTAGDENLGVYDFKDNKTTGTVTVTKIWDDYKTNEKRVIPDIKISTSKPSKSALGYTVTFHGNKAAGLMFDDGSDVNEVVYNSSGNIVEGNFKAISEVKILTDGILIKSIQKKLKLTKTVYPLVELITIWIYMQKQKRLRLKVIMEILQKNIMISII